VSDDLQPPLVPADVDLRDFGFMPLDVVRLRDSDLAALASGDEFRAAVLLWCAAWHQVPAASLPGDERLLARYSGAGARWGKVRAMALRGFVKCADGRLYHVVIAEKALESWDRKQAQRDRTRKATEARNEQRNEQRYVERDGQRNDERNGVQGTVKGQGQPPLPPLNRGGNGGGKTDPEYPKIPKYINESWIDREFRAGRLKLRHGESYAEVTKRLIAEREEAKQQ
jgi:hypothetical protein